MDATQAQSALMEELPRMLKMPAWARLNEAVCGELFVLAYLEKRPEGALPGEISRSMKVSSARVAAVLGRLECKGYVLRTPQEHDHRKVNVTLTDMGAEYLAGHRKETQQFVQRLFEELGEADSEQLLRLLHRTVDICLQFE